jgi:hypothetical protein
MLDTSAPVWGISESGQFGTCVFFFDFTYKTSNYGNTIFLFARTPSYDTLLVRTEDLQNEDDLGLICVFCGYGSGKLINS